MKKTSTLNRNFTAAVNTLLSCIMISFLLLFTLSLQPALSQDYDFEQGSDLDKLVVMEAEHYSEYITVGDNTWDPVLEPADASNDTAMMAYTTSSWPSRNDALTSSAVLVYKINFTETGTHYVWARASRTGGGDDSYHFGLDDQIPASGTFINFEEVGEITADTWMWIKWSGASDPEERSGIGAQSYVDVPSAGVHEFQVYIRESGFKIDKIILTITPDVGYTPEGQGPAETLPVGISPLKSQQNAFFHLPQSGLQPAKDSIAGGFYCNQ
jgi:hypothetical protein